MAALPSHGTGFRAETISRDKEEHHIIIKNPIHQEDTTILSVYPITGSKYVK